MSLIKRKKRNFEIKRWDNGEIIHSGEYESLADCFNAAASDKKSFYCADLRYADLSEANLRYADLSYADLCRADLREANLLGADLSYADLRYADLHGTNLRGADLRAADLSETSLSYANLHGADLREAKNVNEIKSFNYVVGDGVAINSMQFGKYKIAVMGDICCVGCATKTCQEWLDYSGDDLDEDDKKYLEGIAKPYIRMILAMREGE